MKSPILVTALPLVVLASGMVAGQQASPEVFAPFEAALGKLPLYFIENRGVYRDEVAYYVQGADKTLFFTRDGITFALRGRDRGWAVKLEFVGAGPDVRPAGESRRKAVFSYFKGEQADWKTGLPTFKQVAYRNLWPGIDLVYTGSVDRLKYEFVVKPGADPARIALRYRGATGLSLTEAGGLRIETPGGSFEDAPPVAYQEVDGTRVPVEMAFDLEEERGGSDRFGFRVGRFDPSRPLILDPAVIVYCGFLGGAEVDGGVDIAVDASGNTYVVGNAKSTQSTFPVKVGPYLWHKGYAFQNPDAFVAKIDAAGTDLVYCGYIGGSSSDSAAGVAVDAAGNAYVVGSTESTQANFPEKTGPDLTHNGGTWDAFVAKVNAEGTDLVYCGYIGGAAGDYGAAISVDAAGNAYVVGATDSTEGSFPVGVGPDLTHNGYQDAFVAKVNAAGTGLTYCGYIGGSGGDGAADVAVDAAGNAYVTGNTSTTDTTFPVRVGPDLTYNGGATDAWVAKVNAAGAGLVYCGYIGGSGDEASYGISIDAAGNAYVAGHTSSTEATFPVKIGPDLTHNGGTLDAFVAEVNAAGTGLVYCGYIGGAQNESVYGISADAAGNAYLVGSTGSTESSFPVKSGPDPTYNGGTKDAFVAKVAAAGAGLAYCGFIGGSVYDYGMGISIDAAGNAYVTGDTNSTEADFPVKVGPDLTYNGGLRDGFVAKVSLTLLEGSGTCRPGTPVALALTASMSAGLVYQVGSSLGTGPIPIDTRRIDLSPDALLAVSVGGLWPTVFQGYRGAIDSRGRAQAAIDLPDLPALVGVRLHSAFVAVSASAPSGIDAISNTLSFSIAR